MDDEYAMLPRYFNAEILMMDNDARALAKCLVPKNVRYANIYVLNFIFIQYSEIVQYSR